MKKNYRVLLVLTLILLPALAFWHFALHPAYPAVPIAPERQLSKKLLLVPLDGSSSSMPGVSPALTS